jgi:hypothetical protein
VKRIARRMKLRSHFFSSLQKLHPLERIAQCPCRSHYYDAALLQATLHTLRQSHCSVVFRHAQRYLFTAASMALPALAKSSGTITG